MTDRQSFYVGSKGIIETEQGILVLRSVKKGLWELPGGRVDAGQDIETALIRELTEELPGVSVTSVGSVVHVAVGDFTVENEHKLLLVFSTVSATLPDTITLSEEHTEAGFVAAETLDSFDLFTTDRAALEMKLL